MQQKLSPKKYIETQARKLPVYKCLVNTGWQEDRMANIIVMRQHITGNITLGFYLVDLLCLGIKDTYYIFNTTKEEAEEKFENHLDIFEEINYNLAHNIVFAGHDFAMEYDIPPHKDFALTKYILDEDNDDIGLIDIAVGDAKDGKPHLIINPQGQGKWALEKLIKNAGEDNYYYTTKDDFEQDNEEEVAEDRSLLITDYDMGTISAYAAKDISTESLLDTDEIMKRDGSERLHLFVECMIRVFENDTAYDVITEEEFITTAEYQLTDNCDTDEINCGVAKVYIEDLDEEGYIEEDIKVLCKIHDKPALAKSINEFVNKYSSNFYALSEVFRMVSIDFTSLVSERKRICDLMNSFAQIYPLAKLFLAFDSLYNNINDLRFAFIQYSNDLQVCFPQCSGFGAFELQLYWLIKTLKSIKGDDFEESIFYYQLAVETLEENEFLMQVQIKLVEYFNSKIS
jgi:hypothetical protein